MRIAPLCLLDTGKRPNESALSFVSFSIRARPRDLAWTDLHATESEPLHPESVDDESWIGPPSAPPETLRGRQLDQVNPIIRATISVLVTGRQPVPVARRRGGWVVRSAVP